MKSPVPYRASSSIAPVPTAPFEIGRSRERKWWPFARSASRSGPAKGRLRAATAVVVTAASLLTVTGTQITGAEVAARGASETGFFRPYSGPRRFEYLAPTQATDPSQIHQAIGLERANYIAGKLRLKEEHTLTEDQFQDFISGGGVGGRPGPAALADESVRIFTNTTGYPLFSDVDGVITETVLASYGLFVNVRGLLQSLANEHAPTRQANVLLEPGGYINTWFLANGAKRSLLQLYTSAYTVEAVYGFISQTVTDLAQLVPNIKGGVRTEVGMSMVPSIWLTNFALLYTLKPEIAARMPAYWTPIPTKVAAAIHASPDGQVEYSRFASDLQQ